MKRQKFWLKPQILLLLPLLAFALVAMIRPTSPVSARVSKAYDIWKHPECYEGVSDYLEPRTPAEVKALQEAKKRQAVEDRAYIRRLIVKTLLKGSD